MRPKHLGKRKRQRPSYLHDFLDEDEEDGEFSSQKKPMEPRIQEDNNIEIIIKVEGEEDKCCLCDGKIINNRVDIGSATGSSDLTYSQVLNKMLSQSSEHQILQNIPKLQFNSGYLCIFCKVPLSDLDLLQHKIIGLMKVILLRAEGKLKSFTQENKIQSESQKLLDEKEFKSCKLNESLVKPKPQIVAEKNKEVMKKRNKNRRKPKLPVSDVDTQSESEAEDSGSRPRRDKPSGTMSDIERAKIKNLPADLKFHVKKRSKKDPFIIEFLKEKKGTTYLVKWENRHENENSWEPRSKIPPDVLDYYEQDLRRLGTQVPVLSSPRDFEIKEKSRVKPAEVKESKNTKHQEKDMQIKNPLEQKEGKKDERLQETEMMEMEEIVPIIGEYIEQPFEDILDSVDTELAEDSSHPLIIKEDVEEPRKSKREPKPKILEKEFVCEFEKSKKGMQEKRVQEEVDDSTLVRKSNREPKPKKFMDQTNFKKNKKDKKVKNPSLKKKKPTSKAEPKTYIIESLVERKGDKYLVKWESYPPEQSTWEPRANIPKFITQFYEQDTARLGMPAPDVS